MVPMEMKSGWDIEMPRAMRKLKARSNSAFRQRKPHGSAGSAATAAGTPPCAAAVIPPSMAVPIVSDQQPSSERTRSTERAGGSPKWRLKSTLYSAAHTAAPSTKASPLSEIALSPDEASLHGCATSATPAAASRQANTLSSVSRLRSRGTASSTTSVGVTLKSAVVSELVSDPSAATYIVLAPAHRA